MKVYERVIVRVLFALIVVGIVWLGAAAFNPDVSSGTVWWVALLVVWLDDPEFRE